MKIPCLFDPPYHPIIPLLVNPQFLLDRYHSHHRISNLVVEVGVNQVSHGSYDQTISFFWMFMCCISPIQIETWCGKPRNKPNNATHTTHTNSSSGWYYQTDPFKKLSFWAPEKLDPKNDFTTLDMAQLLVCTWHTWERIQNTELYHWAKVIYRRHLYYIPIRNNS